MHQGCITIFSINSLCDTELVSNSLFSCIHLRKSLCKLFDSLQLATLIASQIIQLFQIDFFLVYITFQPHANSEVSQGGECKKSALCSLFHFFSHVSALNIQFTSG